MKTFFIISIFIAECWIYLNLKRNSPYIHWILFSSFFCYNFLGFFSKEIFLSLAKISFLLNFLFLFPPFFFSRQFSLHIHVLQKILLMPWIWNPFGTFATIRLVKRRVEKHQQHSITHTSFTEKYVEVGSLGGDVVDKLFALFPGRSMLH